MTKIKRKFEEKYPIGTHVRLIHMSDPQPVSKGTIGVVDFIDDIGQIHVKWENGSSLALVEGVDEFEIINTDLSVAERRINSNQILKEAERKMIMKEKSTKITPELIEEITEFLNEHRENCLKSMLGLPVPEDFIGGTMDNLYIVNELIFQINVEDSFLIEAINDKLKEVPMSGDEIKDAIIGITSKDAFDECTIGFLNETLEAIVTEEFQ